jgi:hypothetical protein
MRRKRSCWLLVSKTVPPVSLPAVPDDCLCQYLCLCQLVRLRHLRIAQGRKAPLVQNRWQYAIIQSKSPVALITWQLSLQARVSVPGLSAGVPHPCKWAQEWWDVNSSSDHLSQPVGFLSYQPQSKGRHFNTTTAMLSEHTLQGSDYLSPQRV